MQMSERVVSGWLRDRDMPAHVAARVGKSKSFADVHKTFVAKATPLAQNGTDYDIPNEPPCFDQGNEGSCVLNSTTGAAAMLLSVEQDAVVLLSRNFGYWICREAMGTTTQDSGTYVNLACALLGQVGVPRETTWIYDSSTFFVAPPPECYPEASDNRITAWFSIPDQPASGPSRLDMIEAAIRSNHPVCFGTAVDNAIMGYTTGNILSAPTGSIIGGHSMLASGIRYINGQRVWRWRNSWLWRQRPSLGRRQLDELRGLGRPLGTHSNGSSSILSHAAHQPVGEIGRGGFPPLPFTGGCCPRTNEKSTQKGSRQE
jgi:hypothetical protein